MTKRLLISLIVIASFLVADKLDLLLDQFGLIPESIVGPTFTVLNKTIMYIFLPLSILALLHGRKNLLRESGLGGDFLLAMRIAGIGVLPMFLGAAILSGFELRLSIQGILIGCLLAAVAEELLYRSFLFGQLFRHGGWGFLPAAMVSALIFGLGHLYQSNDLMTSLGIFGITFLGGLWFSWLFVEWDYNIWVPMGFHFFMNLSWTVFEVSDNALGGWGPNIFRIATIVLSIYLTQRHKKQGSPVIIKGKRWFFGHTAARSMSYAIRTNNSL